MKDDSLTGKVRNAGLALTGVATLLSAACNAENLLLLDPDAHYHAPREVQQPEEGSFLTERHYDILNSKYGLGEEQVDLYFRDLPEDLQPGSFQGLKHYARLGVTPEDLQETAERRRR